MPDSEYEACKDLAHIYDTTIKAISMFSERKNISCKELMEMNEEELISIAFFTAPDEEREEVLKNL